MIFSPDYIPKGRSAKEIRTKIATELLRGSPICMNHFPRVVARATTLGYLMQSLRDNHCQVKVRRYGATVQLPPQPICNCHPIPVAATRQEKWVICGISGDLENFSDFLDFDESSG